MINGKDSGRIYSAMTYSPFVERLPGVPGWFYYGVHAVEPLLARMGGDYVDVRCTVSEEYGPVAIGTWSDGRNGIAKATCKSTNDYGFVVWTEKGVHYATLDKSKVYHGLYRELISFFRTGVSPLAINETLKVMSFMEAANTSMYNGGRTETLAL